ncbi:MAG TPA: hypothetical protein VNH83_20575 [Bryobacteraceae bacterium]|nr:hypothetical protein [Bryobacteraceae bacterium]
MPKEMQFAFRVDFETGERVKAGAQSEEIATADFIRKLIRYALQQYEAAGSLHALRTAANRELVQKQTTISRGVHDNQAKEKVGRKDKSDRFKAGA